MNAIDTDLLVHAVDASEPAKQSRAIQLLTALSQETKPLVIPWQVAVEFVACLRRWEDAGRIARDLRSPTRHSSWTLSRSSCRRRSSCRCRWN